jgi:alpha-mannosidase
MRRRRTFLTFLMRFLGYGERKRPRRAYLAAGSIVTRQYLQANSAVKSTPRSPVLFSNLKVADDKQGIIARRYEISNQDSSLSLTFPWRIDKANKTNLIEDNLPEQLNDSGGIVHFTAGHRAVDAIESPVLRYLWEFAARQQVLCSVSRSPVGFAPTR